MTPTDDTPEDWMRLGGGWLARLLRPLGLWLCDRGYAKQVRRTWNYTNGQFWEMHAWQVGPLVVPFSPLFRNKLEEITTPEILAFWMSTPIRSFRPSEDTTHTHKNNPCQRNQHAENYSRKRPQRSRR